jgi:hypothetical protein
MREARIRKQPGSGNGQKIWQENVGQKNQGTLTADKPGSILILTRERLTLC